MRKLWVCAVLALGLAGCGQGQNTPAASGSAAPQPQASAAASTPQDDCKPSMGITVEKLLMNMDDGLKATNAPTAILDKGIEQDKCGYLIKMTTEYGDVRVQTNDQQEVLLLGAGYKFRRESDINIRNMFAVIQTVISTEGRAKFGETEVGMKLFEALTETITEAKQSGTNMVHREISLNGKTYLIFVEANEAAILVYK